MEFKALYLPIGTTSYNMDEAKMKFNDSVSMLRQVDKNIVIPDGPLTSLESVLKFIKDERPSLVIVQNITFAGGNYITEIARNVDCPVLLWAIPEPVVDGQKIRLNSISGAYTAANIMENIGREFSFVVGSTFDDETGKRIGAVLTASKLKVSLNKLNLLQVGNASAGFGFGKGIENELMRCFGVNLVQVESRKLVEKAKSYDEDEIRHFIFDVQNIVPNIFNINRENLFDAGRLFKAYFDFCNENNIGAVSSGCMHDLNDSYGTPVCGVLSFLNDLGFPSACEADTYGALSIYICQYLSKMPAYFGSPVNYNEEYNCVTLWNCGMAPPSIAREDSRAQVGVHHISGVGPVMDFGCRSTDHATVFRVGKKSDGTFRFFVANGRSIDRFKQFSGTTIVIETKNNVRDVIENSVKNGWEPYFAVAMTDISAEIKALAELLGIECVEF